MTAPATGTRCAKGQLNVTGSRWHVDDKVIEIAPIRIAEQLRQRLRDHGPAPDHRLLRIDQKPDRHGTQAVCDERFDAFAIW
jgi:hypothetical protein